MYSAIALSRYGSLEIKRAYRKNMFAGMITAAMFMILSVSVYHYFTATTAEIPSTILGPGIGTVNITDIPVQRIYDIPKPAQSSIDKPIPSAGIPTPVPDKDAPDNSAYPSQDDLKRLIDRNRSNDSTFFNKVAVSVQDTEQLIPRSDTFIRYDEPPKPIESVEPIYPEMARLAGVQGDVWIRAYIDKDGNVRAVEIMKASGASAGFEESAIAAAKATSWKPAISNGQPVGVWISYKISFRIK
jgi:periplasmic protein TonB